MTVALLVVALLGTWNVFRLHPGLPAGRRSRAQRVGVAALGSAAALAGLAVVATFADDLLDWLEISPPTARIAVGAVVALWGLRDLVAAPPDPEPSLPGWNAALVPVLFPFLFSPPAGLLALSGSADQGTAAVVVAAALALVPIVVSAGVTHFAPGGTARRAEVALGRLVAGVLVLAGFALVIDGVFDI